MIVYGDRERHLRSEQLLKNLEKMAEKATHEQGAARREAWRNLTIETGSAAQALLDSAHASHACDGWSTFEQLCHGLCRSAADGFLSTLGYSHVSAQATATFRSHLAALQTLSLPEQLKLHEIEGYAYYCIYPELYARAALRWSQERARGPVHVIGIRSIGCSLGAVVAATLEAQHFCTVRPAGHPFARTISPSAELAHLLLKDSRDADYAIVDEGPGLSGSSFAAVAHWLLDHGVADHQLHFFPSHAGEPGSQCTPRFRTQYAAAARHQLSFDQDIAKDGGQTVASWFEESLGRPLEQPVEELTGGRWRQYTYGQVRSYPAANIPKEARKYLLRCGGRRWLAKFLGLGESRRQLTNKLRTLGEYGFTPALRGARHGFGLFEWQEGAVPLAHSDLPRERLVQGVARYLTFLARAFPTSDGGARPTALMGMAEHNLRECLGADGQLAEQLASYRLLLPEIEQSHSPVVSDNKLDSHEWLVRPDGRLIKCDALEHAHAHDLVGCQDPAWDLMGAAVELELSDDEISSLQRALRDVADVRISPQKLAFFRLVYLAFRLGQAHLAEQSLAPWPDDARRMKKSGSRYRQQLHTLLDTAPKMAMSS